MLIHRSMQSTSGPRAVPARGLWLCLIRWAAVASLLLATISHAAETTLEQGQNLYSVPGAVPAEAATCYGLLDYLGGAAFVASIAMLDPDTQQTSECSFDAAVATGADFPIRAGEAYFVEMLGTIAIGAELATVCPSLDLRAGVNLIGIPTPSPGESCFGLLARIEGAEAIERLNRGSQQFEPPRSDCAASLAEVCCRNIGRLAVIPMP